MARATRRDFLRYGILAGSGVVMAACGATPTLTPVPPTATKPPATVAPAVPTATKAPAPPTATKPPAPAVKTGGTLNFAQTADAPGLDPHKAPSFATLRMTEQIYDALLTLDYNMKLIPGLATAWQTPDPVTYIFSLRKGVKFHDGREFTANDVKYSMERMLDKNTAALAASYFVAVDKMEVPDSYTIKFTLKNAFAPFLTNLASYYAMMVPRELGEANIDLQKVAIGTGPFKLGNRVPDNVTKLERNRDYYVAGQPYLDSINVFTIKDEAAIVAALRAKQIDLTTLSATQAQLIKSDPNLKVIFHPSLAYDYLGFNNAVPPFSDVRVRQAISYAIDRQRIIDAVIWGEAKLTGPVPPAMADWAIATNSYPFYTTNVAKAKELLAAAGYANGFKSSIKVGTQQQADAAQVIQSQLKAVGIETELVSVDWGTYVADWRASNFEMIYGGNQGRADPDEYTYFHFNTKGSANVWKFSNAEIDALTEKGRTTLDLAERKAVYSDLQKKIVEQTPIVFVASRNSAYAYQSYVRDFVPMPNAQNFAFKVTWLDK